MVIRIIHRLLLLLVVICLIVIGVCHVALLLLRVVRRPSLLGSSDLGLLVGVCEFANVSRGMHPLIVVRELLLLILLLMRLRVRMPFLRGLPLRLVRRPFFSRFELHGRASEARLPLGRVRPHEPVIRHEIAVLLILGPVLIVVSLLPGVLGFLHHLSALLILSQAPEALVLVSLRLVFLITILSIEFFFRLLVRLLALVLVLTPVFKSLLLLLRLLHSRVLVFALAVLPSLSVLLLGLSLLVIPSLLMITILILLTALVLPLFGLLAILDDGLDQRRNLLGRWVLNSLLLLSRHLTLLALFKVPLELCGEAETFQNHGLILARLGLIGLLVLNEGIGKIEF